MSNWLKFSYLYFWFSREFVHNSCDQSLDNPFSNFKIFLKFFLPDDLNTHDFNSLYSEIIFYSVVVSTVIEMGSSWEYLTVFF